MIGQTGLEKVLIGQTLNNSLEKRNQSSTKPSKVLHTHVSKWAIMQDAQRVLGQISTCPLLIWVPMVSRFVASHSTKARKSKPKGYLTEYPHLTKQQYFAWKAQSLIGRVDCWSFPTVDAPREFREGFQRLPTCTI